MNPPNPLADYGDNQIHDIPPDYQATLHVRIGIAGVLMRYAYRGEPVTRTVFFRSAVKDSAINAFPPLREAAEGVEIPVTAFRTALAKPHNRDFFTAKGFMIRTYDDVLIENTKVPAPEDVPEGWITVWCPHWMYARKATYEYLIDVCTEPSSYRSSYMETDTLAKTAACVSREDMLQWIAFAQNQPDLPLEKFDEPKPQIPKPLYGVPCLNEDPPRSPVSRGNRCAVFPPNLYCARERRDERIGGGRAAEGNDDIPF